MIVADLDLGPWQPGEHTRYVACSRHARSNLRLDFDRAVDVAEACPRCRVQFRKDPPPEPNGGPTHE